LPHGFTALMLVAAIIAIIAAEYSS